MKNQPIIAIVHDDIIYRFSIQKILQKSKWFSDILLFENGSPALTYLREHNTPELLPDIILLDIAMPVMDAWDFLEQYQKLSSILNKQITIFVHTVSLIEEELNKTAKYSCVAGIIPIPLHMDELQRQMQLH